MMNLKYYFKRIPLWINNKICTLVMTHGANIPDSIYLQIIYFLQMKKRLHLNNPKTFSEKLQWLKLYNRKPEYTGMVDKYSAKEYASNIIGENYIIPTLGLWDKVDEIDFDSLPNQFVLKTTNGGGGHGVVICRNKDNFDISKAKAILERALKEDIYKCWREWPYKNIKPRIIAEKYMEDENGSLKDYKFSQLM